MLRHPPRRFVLLLALLLGVLAPFRSTPAPSAVVHASGPTLPSPILFVTHVPTAYDVLTTVTIFNNQTGDVHAAGRGGDLWLRLPDGTLKNLTQLAGLGSTGQGGFQDQNAIAVRDPSVSWDGATALFSMVVGAPAAATASPPTYYWQIYELTNLDQVIAAGATPVIRKLQHQPAYNNITPLYGTNGRILFTSDAPRFGQAHLYPLLDEYNMRPTNTGLWSLDEQSGDLVQIDDSPSGDMTPSIDSFGRVILSRWDHLERDQQFDFDYNESLQGRPCQFCTFNDTDESAQATSSPTTANNNPNRFPEPRPNTPWLSGTNLAGHHMNEFLPWQMNEDGSNAETLNHIGRHELIGRIPAAFTDDSNLQSLNGPQPGAANQNRVKWFLQIREDPANPGSYYGTNAQELTHASGQIVRLSNAAPTNNADQMAMTWITHHDTFSTTATIGIGPATPPPHSDGHYRDPLPLSDSTLLASYTTVVTFESVLPFQTAPKSRFDFRLYTLGPDPNNPGYLAHSQLLTGGLPTKTVSYYDKTTLVQFSGQLWELQPVEVRPRPKPGTLARPPLAQPELNAFQQAGVTPQDVEAFLTQHNLALIVSRNVTRRDDADTEQPLRLQIGSSGAISVPPGSSGKLYRIDDFQIMQADQLRGLTGSAKQPGFPGRRVLGQPLHDPVAVANNPPGALPGSVALGQDGSMAAFVPARRALSWQMTDPNGVPVVRERVWVTMQPGEVRVCAACHGVNANDQTGAAGVPTNTPQALIDLLKHWKSLQAVTPTLTALTPASAAAGSPAFTLTLSGSGFASDSQVQWNGAPRPTTFVSSTQLRAAIGAADLASAGTASVFVTNPSAATVSNSLTFTITTPGQNPVPSLTALTPPSAAAGGPGFTLTLSGSGFVGGAVVHWGATSLTPATVSGGQITVLIPAGGIATAGSVPVTVVNPGGGASNVVPFTVTPPQHLYVPLALR